jgi:hypothetical protein
MAQWLCRRCGLGDLGYRKPSIMRFRDDLWTLWRECLSRRYKKHILSGMTGRSAQVALPAFTVAARR